MEAYDNDKTLSAIDAHLQKFVKITTMYIYVEEEWILLVVCAF